MIIPEWLFELPIIEPERIEFWKMFRSQIVTHNTKWFDWKTYFICRFFNRCFESCRSNRKLNFRSLLLTADNRKFYRKNSEPTRSRLFLFIQKCWIYEDSLVPTIVWFYFSMSLFYDWTEIRCSYFRHCSRKRKV